jgi:hypothetical protein
MWIDCRAPAQLNFFFEGDFDKDPPVLVRFLSANELDESFLSDECDKSFLLEESDDALMLLCRRWACMNC